MAWTRSLRRKSDHAMRATCVLVASGKDAPALTKLPFGLRGHRGAHSSCKCRSILPVWCRRHVFFHGCSQLCHATPHDASSRRAQRGRRHSGREAADYDGDLIGETSAMVKTCCRSFPATACQPDIQPAAICKDEADFQPDNVGAAYCDTYDPDRFPDRASCEADGFSWVEVTCEQMRKKWDSRKHVAFSEASKQHMCEHFRLDGTTVDQLMAEPSRHCCATRPTPATRTSRK